MSTVSVVPGVSSFSERLYSLFDKIDYRIAATDAERDEIFRLRYDAYLREKTIAPSFSRRLSDRYDDLDNSVLVSLHLDGSIAATIRIGVLTAEERQSPAMETFADVVGPLLDRGQVIIDPTRHATSEAFSHRYVGLMPYFTTRVAIMAAEHFGADTILASVRPEHQAFYRRIFGCEVVCPPRDYPPLTKPLSLMTLDYKGRRDTVKRRYPTFRSTLFERRSLFLPLLAADQRLAETAPIETRAVGF